MDFNPGVLMTNLNKDASLVRGELKQYKISVLQRTLLKKFVSPNSAIMLDKAARNEFNRRSGEVANFIVPESTLVNELALQLSIDLSSDWDGSVCTEYLSMAKIVEYGGTGPGASVLAPENDFVTKLFSPTISSTSVELYDYYRSTLPSHWDRASRHVNQRVVVVSGAKLSTVPKDSSKNRTICIEPTLNMYFQQGIRAQLEKCLKQRYRIDISNQQDFNKALARKGSITGELATIDLSNASDTISYNLCRAILPPQSFAVLDRCRSPNYIDNGNTYAMGMMSTMGNAFTFPLMTLILAALCTVVARRQNIRLFRGNFGVFGDDIIVPTVIYTEVLDALSHLGLIPNFDKSFGTGFFRESCGGDYIHGCDVRGVYVKRMENEQDVYSAFNRLHRWSIDNGIALYHSLSYLMGMAAFRPVPRHESFDSGYIIARSQLTSPKTDRNGAYYYRAATSARRVRRVTESSHNPLGALIGCLGGHVRDNLIALRPRNRKVIVVKKKSPCWDFSNDAVFVRQGLELSWRILLSFR